MNRNNPLADKILYPCDFYPKYCCGACTHFRKCAPGARTLRKSVPGYSRRRKSSGKVYRTLSETGRKKLCLIMTMPAGSGSRDADTV